MISDRPTYIRIDLDNILENYKNIQKKSGNKKVLAVVKSDAYGLGAKIIAEYLYENGVNYFAVATLEEAIELRTVVPKSLILVLGIINIKNINHAIVNDISITCPSVNWLVNAISKMKNLNGTLKIHLKIDSGMSRIGIINEREAKVINDLICKNNNIYLEGVFTHLSNADGIDSFYDNYQYKKFLNIKSFIKKIPEYTHIENSAAILKRTINNKEINICRAGIALFGQYPSNIVKEKTDVVLKNVSSLVSEVVHVKKVPDNTYVGYGCKYKTDDNEYIATVPIGYRDGVLRRASGFSVSINNKFYKIIGNICMDQLMIKCDEDVKIGDKVLFFGEYGNQKINMFDFAEFQNTIAYEILCIIGSRVPRKYFINDKEVKF